MNDDECSDGHGHNEWHVCFCSLCCGDSCLLLPLHIGSSGCSSLTAAAGKGPSFLGSKYKLAAGLAIVPVAASESVPAALMGFARPFKVSTRNLNLKGPTIAGF